MAKKTEMPQLCKSISVILLSFVLSTFVSAICILAVFSDECSAAEDSWTKEGTCEWRFDETTKTLTIRPYQGADSGYIANVTLGAPWHQYNKLIEVVVFEGNISLKGKCEYLFSGCKDLREFHGLDALDISQATSLMSFFANCSSVKSLDISNWNTSNVTSFLELFYNCSSLESLDLSNWDTSNVTTMNYTFNGCSSLKALNIDGWDTANVSSMRYMFSNCRSLKVLDVTHFIYPHGMNIQHMFEYCTSLKSLDFSNCDLLLGDNTIVSRYNLLGLFTGCTSLEYVDMSGISVPADSAVTPFVNCLSLSRVKIGPGFNGRIAFPMGYWSNEQGECFEEFDIPLNLGGLYTYLGTVKEASFPANSIKLELSDGRYKMPLSLVSRGMQEADISWASSNPEVASVDSSGVVRPYKTGKTTITVTADRATAKCDVVVVDTPKQPESSVDPLPEVPDVGPGDNIVSDQPADPVSSMTPIAPSVPAPSIALKGVSIKKLSKFHKGFMVKWSKLSSKLLNQITGYKIKYSTKKSMKSAKTKILKATSANGKKRTLKISKLKAKKKYYVQVATYRMINGKIYLSNWSKVKSIKTK